ncbi:hypothetical protein [Jeongeupia naejangsanensis]|uniref:Uncharacterized protein n=1 Tax=Jeongeupia naejangsanensis TaxID=613195 RepID=A0ABS2BKD4_9NEIS|nr:hypothetical protein [Jeongeupia naejangsanensis]MBM3116069.1 hypothetical protein [Jeongeupia naejangsanensis]
MDVPHARNSVSGSMLHVRLCHPVMNGLQDRAIIQRSAFVVPYGGQTFNGGFDAQALDKMNQQQVVSRAGNAEHPEKLTVADKLHVEP